MFQSPATWRRLYILLYMCGFTALLLTVAALFRIAYFILINAEPLAALDFLPQPVRPFAVPLLVIIMILGAVSWNKGAQLQERSETLQRQKVKM